MSIYVIIFFLIVFLAIEYQVGSNKALWPFFVLVIFLAFFAGLRAPDVPKDYLLYQFAFDNIDNSTIATGNLKNVYEPGFFTVVLFFKWILPNYYTIGLMLLFAFTAVTINSLAIIRFSFNPYLALLIYFSNFFFLHEMTQIRVGLASAIFLISIPYYIKKQFALFSSFIILAALFHYSALLYFGTFLFRRNNFKKIWFTSLLIISIPIGILKLQNINIFKYLTNLDSSNDKLVTYSNIAEFDLNHSANIFNVSNIINMLICGYLLYIIPKEDLTKDRYLSLFLKFNIISIFLFCLNSENALLAFRVSELFAISSIFLFPYMVKYLPFKKFNIWFVVLIAFVYFYINIFGGDLMKPYHTYKIF